MLDQKFIIIDGNSLMHRAFYALPPLRNSKGLHTNVIYGFVNMINKIKEEYKPDFIGIAFDRKAPTFRHIEYAEYKAGRKKMPEEMAEQIPYLKEVIDAMNIKRVEIDGYEADDIIGAVAKKSEELNINTFVVTGDRDVFQLISDKVKVLITKKGISDMEKYDKDKLIEVYGITPKQVPDFKGLMGDASDNIPGVPGVGEKTALELLKQFDSIENLIENMDKISKPKLRAKIEENKEQAVFSKKLATIMTEIPIEFNIEEFRSREIDYDKLANLYAEFEFKSLLEKLEGKTGNLTQPNTQNSQKKQLNPKELKDITEIQRLIKGIEKDKECVFKTQLSDTGKPNKIYIDKEDKQYYFDIDKNESVFKMIKDLMENEAIKKVSHDIKQDVLSFMKSGINLKGICFDTMIAAYLINPSKGSYNLKEVYYEAFAVLIEDYNAKEGDPIEKYCSSVSAIRKLEANLYSKLKEYEMEKLYFEVELPLVEVLASMEYEGFKVDRDILNKLSSEFSEKLAGLTDSIYLHAGEVFNINSTKQLGVILFDKLKLPVIKKTKTGYSTDVEVLEELSGKHPIIEDILEYRQLLKLKSTYVDGLLNIINPETGKIHSKFNQTVTATGRLSSTDPNLQNIPIKTENGRKIRKVFVPKSDEYTLIDADYSQIELRILAHISGDEGLIDSFLKNEDIHKRTASEVFGVSIDKVTPLMRSRAKAVNFGIVYGISDFGLAKDLKITKREAKEYIDNYFRRYPLVKKYMEDIVSEGKNKGYVKTIMNRIRYIPELNSKNAINRNFGERMAMNTPIQGSAADIIKIAMVKVYNELKRRNLKSKLILQVHDELIIEAHKTEIEEVKELIKYNMENAYELKVPLLVELSAGSSWYDTK